MLVSSFLFTLIDISHSLNINICCNIDLVISTSVEVEAELGEAEAYVRIDCT
jgi:hypothetical protein